MTWLSGLTASSPVGWLAGLALCMGALYLRVCLHLGREAGGVDTWYYLRYVRELQQTRRFPVNLPEYVLDIGEQWYPPVFPLALSWFPLRWLERARGFISPLIDCLQLALLYVFTLRNTDSVSMALIAGSIYAVMPTLVAENVNLNSRAFGSLMMTVIMMAFFRWLQPDHPIHWLVVALIFGGLLPLTHKMTTQQYVFTLLMLSGVFKEWRYLALLAASFLLAFLMSGGFYWKVLKAHWDIVSFYRRHIDEVNAHQVLDSPVYGRAHHHSAKIVYQPGWRGTLKVLARLLGENPFLLVMLMVTQNPGFTRTQMYWWASSVLVFAFLTSFVPALRCIGEGYKYMKLTAFPSAYAIAVSTGPWNPWANLVWLALAVSFGFALAALGVFFRHHLGKRTEHTAVLDSNLKQVGDFLKGLAPGTVLCMPLMYCDYLIYASGQRVLWGVRSGGFKILEPFYYVLRRPIEYFLDTYHVTYMVLDLNYCQPEQLHIAGRLRMLGQFGCLVIYAVGSTAAEPVTAAQSWAAA